MTKSICLSRVYRPNWTTWSLPTNLSLKIQFPRKGYPSYERKGNFASKDWKGGVNRWWLKPRLWLVHINYNFECDWLIELSDYKLPVNSLANELTIHNRGNLWLRSFITYKSLPKMFHSNEQRMRTQLKAVSKL